MAEGGEGTDTRSLEETPTWAVAIVCLGFVLVSIVIERSIHLLAKWLRKSNKKSLSEALEKFKAELMLLGFISFLLTVGQKPISEICIPKSLGDTLLPCKNKVASADRVLYNLGEYGNNMKLSSGRHNRKLMSTEHISLASYFVKAAPRRRVLAAANGSPGRCAEKGKVSLISQDGLHQLHIFIFLLAVFHVLSCIITVALGQAKMSQWKTWEKETKTIDYELSNDPGRFRFTRDTTFGRRHMSFWSRNSILLWITCFFRQFLRSVHKVDYLTLRHGFILAHLPPENNFDFQEYIQRSLEDDFKVIVSISPFLWIFAVLFLLLNREGWFTYFWLSLIPLIILVVVGAKLQVIITRLGLDIQDRNPVVHGPPVVQPNDNLFWFNRPRWILYVIHFTLFENAFQFAFFFWTWYEYGIQSCFHQTRQQIIGRLCLGIGVQILCSYVTLPLYALVTQMGSNMKTAIFKEEIANSLRRWHRTAKKNLRRNMKSENQSVKSGQTTPSGGFSPLHLHNGKHAGNGLPYYESEHELSEIEMAGPSTPSHNSPHYVSPFDNNKEGTEQHAKNQNSSQEGGRQDTPDVLISEFTSSSGEL